MKAFSFFFKRNLSNFGLLQSLEKEKHTPDFEKADQETQSTMNKEVTFVENFININERLIPVWVFWKLVNLPVKEMMEEQDDNIFLFVLLTFIYI